MSEKSSPKKRGQPLKEEFYKVTQKVTIYLTATQVATLEERVMQAGYLPKDKGKWLKMIATTKSIENKEPTDISLLKEKLKACEAISKQKDEMIEILKSR